MNRWTSKRRFFTADEIDGNALAKALFILFALGVWLDMRRRRLARGDA